jgi:ubiquinone/menaquinone biosynthesis C-methylase UbiE
MLNAEDIRTTARGLAVMTAQIIDYDTDGYDYRRYWDSREYERRAESHALARLAPRLGQTEWLVDLGGGFGRNAEHYRNLADHYVIADFSATNLANAAELLADDVAAGRAFLVRCDLNALPFVDAAFDAGLVVRVLHHLPDLDRTLNEMGRVIAGGWLLDVPIKHHVWAMLRAAASGDRADLYSALPRAMGTSADPFWNFRLAEVRRLLDDRGWQSRVVASVNNLRRWDRRLPRPLVQALTPAAHLVEVAAQRGGRGWWGPSQFVLAQRRHPMPVVHKTVPTWSYAPAIASRVACPVCAGALRWFSDEATCTACDRRYTRTGGVWDFAAPA